MTIMAFDTFTAQQCHGMAIVSKKFSKKFRTPYLKVISISFYLCNISGEILMGKIISILAQKGLLANQEISFLLPNSINCH